MLPHKSEIHVLISPDSTADTELPEYGIHIREPAQGIFYRSLINNTEFSTVLSHSGIFRSSNRFHYHFRDKFGSHSL